jgi:uncharacterized damage-inducible protein DinB
MPTATQPQITPEFAVGMREGILQIIEQEIASTQKVIAAVPDAKAGWKPEPKSRTAGELAWHLASEDAILLHQIAEMRFSFPDPRYQNEKPKTHKDMADWYGKRMREAVARIRKMTPQQLVTPVDFYGAMNLPVVMYLSVQLRHSVHHRGQLTVYLRPMGAKVPSIYGPSADEQG